MSCAEAMGIRTTWAGMIVQSDDVDSADGAKDTEYLLIDGTLCIGFIVVEGPFSR
jgi:hypothetical protein